MSLSPAKQKAFTLLELIVVIVILGVLAAIAIPTFQSVETKSQDSATRAKLAAIGRDALAIYALGGTTMDQALATATSETQAYAPGTSAAALTAVLSTGSTPASTTSLVYSVSGSSVGLALLSASGDVCLGQISPGQSAPTWCVPAYQGGSDPAGLALTGVTATASPSATPTPTPTPTPTATLYGTASSPLTLTGAVATVAGLSGAFTNPNAIASDGTNLFVADQANNRIRKVVISTGAVSTLAGSGAGSEADGTGTAAALYAPMGVVSDGTNLYVTDFYGQTVRKIVVSTGVVTTLAGSAGSAGDVDGVGSAARLNYPRHIVLVNNVLYFPEQSGNRIRSLDLATNTVSTLAGSGAASEVDGTGAAAAFNLPLGITSDGTNLFVSDLNGQTLRKIMISTKVVSTIAGSANTSGYVDATGSAARFNNPDGLTTDGTSLYVTDYANNRLRKVVISSGATSTLAGSGSASETDATGTSAALNGPAAATIAGGKLYIVDFGASTLRVVS